MLANSLKCNIGAKRVYYTIIIIRSPQSPILFIAAHRGIPSLDNAQSHGCMESYIVVSITCRCLLQDLRQATTLPILPKSIGNTQADSAATVCSIQGGVSLQDKRLELPPGTGRIRSRPNGPEVMVKRSWRQGNCARMSA